MSENVKAPIWIRLLPEELRGGPQSIFQQELRARKVAASQAPAPILPSYRDTMPIGMAEGGSVHTAKFQKLAEKLKKQGKGQSAFPIAMHALGYEGSIKPGHRRKPGYAAGGYTGDSGDAIMADNVANEKTFVDHDGEFYVNAPMTALIGGPDAVNDIMLRAAKERIKKAESGAQQIRDVSAPIMSSGDAGKSYAPISEVRSSFAAGGLVEDPVTPQSTPAPVGLDTSNLTPKVSQPSVSAPTTASPSFTGIATPAPQQNQPPQPVSGGQGLINQATKYYQGIMSGDDPYYKSLVSSALQQQGASASAGKAGLQQSMAQAGVKGNAAIAGMADYDKASREQAAGIQTSLAQQELGQQEKAAGQLANIGQAEQKFAYQKGVDAMKVALDAGDITGFANAANTALGIKIDTTQMKTQQDAKNLATAMTNLESLNASGQLTMDMAGNDLRTLYRATGGQGDMPADWAQSKLDTIRRSSDLILSVYDNTSMDDAVAMLGSAEAVNGYVSTVDPKSTGLDGFKKDLQNLYVTGGLKMTKDPTTGAVTFSTDPTADHNGLLAKIFGGGKTATLTIGGADEPVQFGGAKLQFKDPVTGAMVDVTSPSSGVFKAGNYNVKVDSTTGGVTLSGVNATNVNGVDNTAIGADGQPISYNGNNVVLDAGSTKYGTASGVKVVVPSDGSAPVPYSINDWQFQYGNADASIKYGADATKAFAAAVTNNPNDPSNQAMVQSLIGTAPGTGSTKLNSLTTGTVTSYQPATAITVGNDYQIDLNNKSLASLRSIKTTYDGGSGSYVALNGGTVSAQTFKPGTHSAQDRQIDDAILSVQKKMYDTYSSALDSMGIGSTSPAGVQLLAAYASTSGPLGGYTP
jgi:hypothetical protein